MSDLTLGLLGTTRKENEFRLPIHPQHLELIPSDLRKSILIEEGYDAVASSRAILDLVSSIRTAR